MNRRNGPAAEVLNNVLDCPNEILTKIFFYLNAKEKMALSKTCKKLNSIILDDQTFLRDLDFSQDGNYLTSVCDVEEYFTDEKIKHEYIKKIDVSDVCWMSQDRELLRNISKAVNLVDVNIKGFKFQDFKELGQFLEPMKNLRRLSGDWPSGQEYFSPWNKYLKVPFGRLAYLSVTICKALDKWIFIEALELCQKLEELAILQAHLIPESKRNRFWMRTPKKLEKLEKVVCCGCDTGIFHTILLDMLPDNPDQWAKILKNDPPRTQYFYFEKNLQVAQELKANGYVNNGMRNPDKMIKGFYARHEYLLREVIRITQNTGSKKICFLYSYTCSLRIEDAKMLLTNPRHQIRYLNLSHHIEAECDVYLIASAFPTLTTLVLSNITRQNDFSIVRTFFLTGTKRKRTGPEDEIRVAYPHTAFKKLVDNLPNLLDLTFCASPLWGFRNWDLSALNLIGGWKNLRKLYLAHVPIVDGQFLIEIGRQCTNLEKLRLENLGSRLSCCYKEGLLKMLRHCKNLKDFAIQQNNFPAVHDLFATLTGNLKLRRVCVQILGRKRGVIKAAKPIEILARSCNLVLFVCEIKGMTQAMSDLLNSSLQRLKSELNRPLFQFEIRVWIGAKKPSRNVDLDLVHKDLMLPQHYNDALYRLGCS